MKETSFRNLRVLDSLRMEEILAGDTPVKLALLDRDGTLMVEPGADHHTPYQIGSVEEIAPVEGVFNALRAMKDAGYALVVVTNQDALGTDANPKETYDAINEAFFALVREQAGADVNFLAICECPHTPEANCDCRKPKTGIFSELENLLGHRFDREKSFMAGDRQSDRLFAENIGVPYLAVTSEHGWTPEIVPGSRACIDIVNTLS